MYSLAELVAFAEAHNPETRAAWENARAQASAAGIARSELFPQLAAIAFGGVGRAEVPSRDSADLCLGIATLRLQAFSAALRSTFTLARKSSRTSDCAASGILGGAVTSKTPFNTQ